MGSHAMSPASLQQVEFVIPNYNGAGLLTRYLPGVVDVASGAQVTVVDDASTDGSVEMLRQGFPSVRVIARERNGGFPATVNDGLCAVERDFVVLLNNDVQVTPGFVNAMLPLLEDKSVFAVSPRTVIPRLGDLDEGAKIVFWHHGLMYTDQRQGVDSVAPILCATGCAAVYRRNMLEDLGGFDEVYSPFYWEDVDLGYRAWKRGWKSLYQPESLVYHQHSTTTARVRQAYTDRVKARNALLMIWRNIEDPKLLARHRLWLPLVLSRRALRGDCAFVRGWMDALKLRDESLAARAGDAGNRRLTDRDIFAALEIKV